MLWMKWDRCGGVIVTFVVQVVAEFLTGDSPGLFIATDEPFPGAKVRGEGFNRFLPCARANVDGTCVEVVCVFFEKRFDGVIHAHNVPSDLGFGQEHWSVKRDFTSLVDSNESDVSRGRLFQENIMKIVFVFVALILSACGVPKKEHMAVQKDLENTKIELAEARRQSEENEATLKGKISELEQQISSLEASKTELENQLAEANASLSMYESKTGGLQKALKATKEELKILRDQRVQAEKRLSQYRALAKKLNSMVESGKLSVKVRNGKMVIQLANAILFESGKTTLKKDGQEALTELGAVLKSIKKRDFLVTGHTDNVPISSGRYKSNWALSTARAVNVVQFLQDAGVSPKKMAAAGYGEYDPVSSNDSKDGKAQNRRIEIILMPNLDELPSLPTNILKG